MITVDRVDRVADAVHASRRVPPHREPEPPAAWVAILAAGTFLMGTIEFMIAGLLPQISRGLRVSEGHSGLLITAFAIGMIIASTAVALATRRLPRRATLTLALLAADAPPPTPHPRHSHRGAGGRRYDHHHDGRHDEPDL